MHISNLQSDGKLPILIHFEYCLLTVNDMESNKGLSDKDSNAATAEILMKKGISKNDIDSGFKRMEELQKSPEEVMSMLLRLKMAMMMSATLLSMPFPINQLSGEDLEPMMGLPKNTHAKFMKDALIKKGVNIEQIPEEKVLQGILVKMEASTKGKNLFDDM